MPTLGTHTVSYWAKDNSGNIETAKTVTITYDGTAPTTTSNAVRDLRGHGDDHADGHRQPRRLGRRVRRATGTTT